jgi:hypothetical protein
MAAALHLADLELRAIIFPVLTVMPTATVTA